MCIDAGDGPPNESSSAVGRFSKLGIPVTLYLPAARTAVRGVCERPDRGDSASLGAF